MQIVQYVCFFPLWEHGLLFCFLSKGPVIPSLVLASPNSSHSGTSVPGHDRPPSLQLKPASFQGPP